MVDVLGPGGPRGPSFGQRLSAGIGRGLERGSQLRQEQQQEEALKKAGFEDLIGLPPEIQKVAIAERLRASGKQQLNPLQESQKALAEQKLSASKSQQSLFDKLIGQQDTSEPAQDGAPMGGAQNMGAQVGGTPESFLASAPEEYLAQIAGFAGQPGQEGIVGNMAKGELNRREKAQKTQAKTFEGERAYQSSYSKKAEEKANQLRETLPKKEMALDFARNAIETGDVGYFSPDKLADATGIDLFRTAKGAQLVTAGKENLLSNLSRVSSKGQNLWFEQRLNSMFPKIGQDKEANLTVQEMIEGENQMDRAYLNEFDRLANEDEKEYGFVRKDIEKRAHDAIKPKEKDIMKRTTYRMKEIEEQEKGLQNLKPLVGKNVVKGTPLTLAMAKLYKDKFGENALAVAEKNGYYIPTVEEYQMIRAQPAEFREALAQ